MAQNIICDGCQTLPAILLVTNTENGDVLGLCPPCSGVWAQGHHAAMAAAFPDQVPDTQDGPDAGTEVSGTAALPATGSEATEQAGGGDNDGDLREPDSGPGGVPARGAGAAGTDDTGEDQEGGGSRGGGPGSGGGQARGADQPGAELIAPS